MKRKHILWIIAGILFLWAISGVLIAAYFKNPDEPLSSGTFGDMFGAVNALFSGLAFAGLIYTIAVQRQELQEQKNSINMQTNEMSLQVKALELQATALEMQVEEMKSQRQETARSANQLELQKQLLDYQLTLATVNDLIKLKNLRIKSLKMDISYSTKIGEEVFSKVVEYDHRALNDFIRPEGLKQLKHYADSYFFLLQFLEEADLEDSYINKIRQIVIVNTSTDELVTLNKIAQEGKLEKNLLLLQKIRKS